MFAVVVFFEVKPAHVAEFADAVSANAKASVETEPGCQQFDVCRSSDDPQTFFLYEIYDDRAAFEAHKATEHFAGFDAISAPWVTSKKVLTYDVFAPNATR
ncbi:MAG: putative quinol monooxygenase [Pseudomonadota bacterium]